MKTLLSVVAQFVLFLFLDTLGGLFFHPFHLHMALSGDALTRRMFWWDGIVLMGIAYLVLLLIAALRKRLGSFVPPATVALVLAALAGYLLKLGLVTVDM